MDEFKRKFNSVLTQVLNEINRRECSESNTNFKVKFQIAINAWGHEINSDWDDIYQEWKTIDQTSSNMLEEDLIRVLGINRFTDYFIEHFATEAIPTIFRRLGISEKLGISNVFDKLNIKDGNMEPIILIAFVTVSAISAISLVNGLGKFGLGQRNNQIDDKLPQPLLPDDRERKHIQPNPEYSLVLIISAAQKNLADSIRRKGKIDIEDSEILYQATQYLSKNNKSIEDIKNQMNRFHVSEESEYDVYLLAIKLRKDESRFNKGVNQLDRYDAFRELPDLALSVEVSERLKMEAYADFDVYVR